MSNGILRTFHLSLLFAVLISTVNFQFDVFAKLRCTRMLNVLCFYPENKTHFSIKSLSKEMLQPKLEEGWELGDLYRVGDPTIGGWPW